MKEFLSRHGVEYTERDIRKDPSAIRELQQLGAMATPVTVVDGEAVLGFDEAGFRKLLGLDAKAA